MLLGQILIKKKWISQNQLDEIIKRQTASTQKLGELLIKQGLIAPQQLERALTEQYWRRNGFWVIE